MTRIISIAVLTLLCASALAHEMTERYIPIGASPGVSGKLSYTGPIQAVDARARTLTIADASGTHAVKITEHTRVYLDRSQLALENLVGDFADCRAGLTAEIKYTDPATKDTAEWVKIRVTQR